MKENRLGSMTKNVSARISSTLIALFTFSCLASSASAQDVDVSNDKWALGGGGAVFGWSDLISSSPSVDVAGLRAFLTLRRDLSPRWLTTTNLGFVGIDEYVYGTFNKSLRYRLPFHDTAKGRLEFQVGLDLSFGLSSEADMGAGFLGMPLALVSRFKQVPVELEFYVAPLPVIFILDGDNVEMSVSLDGMTFVSGVIVRRQF